MFCWSCETHLLHVLSMTLVTFFYTLVLYVISTSQMPTQCSILISLPYPADVMISDMDLDDGMTGPVMSKTKKRRNSGRVQKRGRGKPRNTLVFPTYKKGKRVNNSKSKKSS